MKRSPKRSPKKRSPIKIPLTKGSLGAYGYKNIQKSPTRTRHSALSKAAKHEDPLAIFRKLNVLTILNKNKNKKLSDLFKKDRDWIKSKYL